MNPLLSICCTTFNHEKYIKQTLDGFLLQQTSFPIEIIVHDDASTDNTAEIIREYAEKDSRIVPILQTENQFSKFKKPWANYVFPRAQGKYIALCEGDDYWIDPFKLQKQVDFLEAHPDYGSCFHNSKIFYQDTQQLEHDILNKDEPETSTIVDLARTNYIRTNTIVLRNNFKLQDWFNYLPVGDWPLFLIQIKDLKIKRFEEEMGVYRVHSQGAWSGADEIQTIKMTLNTIKPLLKHNVLSKPANKLLRKRYRKYKKKQFKYYWKKWLKRK